MGLWKVHVYGGVSYYGKTKLVFATGTTGFVSKYANPKTKKPYAGVCAEEYQDILRDELFPQATSIFARGTRRWPAAGHGSKITPAHMWQQVPSACWLGLAPITSKIGLPTALIYHMWKMYGQS